MLFSRNVHCRISSLRWTVRRSFSSSRLRPDRVRIVEVGPRDGLQNEKAIVPLPTKLELIDRLSRTGLRDIEAGAFVSPKWIPQMANSTQILEHILRRSDNPSHPISYSFLVPNMKGLEAALAVSAQASDTERPSDLPPTPPTTPPPEANEVPSGAPFSVSHPPSYPDEVAVFAAATESFSRKNINCSIAESLDRFQPVISLAKAHGIRVRAYISVVLGCPYEGPDVSPTTVSALATSLLDLGADEISLGDTTGMGTTPRLRDLLRTLDRAGVPFQKLAVHLHDTYGQALANSVVALEQGIRIFDASVAGLGGCPYAKGSTGNVATEDLVYLLHSLGIETGVDLTTMAKIGGWISSELQRANGSRAGRAILAKESST